MRTRSCAPSSTGCAGTSSWILENVRTALFSSIFLRIRTGHCDGIRRAIWLCRWFVGRTETRDYRQRLKFEKSTQCGQTRTDPLLPRLYDRTFLVSVEATSLHSSL